VFFGPPCVYWWWHVVQAKKQYEKAFRDWEKVQESHGRIEQDVYVSRVDVEKVRTQIRAYPGHSAWLSLHDSAV